MKQRLAQILQPRRGISVVALTTIFAGILPLSLMANTDANGTLYWNPPHSKQETHSPKSERSRLAKTTKSTRPAKTEKSHSRANRQITIPSLAQQADRSASKAAPTPEKMTASRRKELLEKALAVTPSSPPSHRHRDSKTPAHDVQNSRSLATAPSPASEQNALQNGIIISVTDQKLAIVQNGEKASVYPISTSRYGLGDGYGTYTTPLGLLEVAQKIGQNLPLGSVFKDRHPTGEILKPNTPGRDPIVTRIIWLRGTEECNRNAYSRGIYIHGTPEERELGRPASFGCIRMRSRDVVKVFQDIAVGTKVQIANKSLRQIMKENAAIAREQAITNEIISASSTGRTAKQ